jgi:hypothetical protein
MTMIELAYTLAKLLASLPSVVVVGSLGFNYDAIWILPVNLILWGFVIGLIKGRRRVRRLQQFSALLKRCNAGRCSEEELQLARDVKRDPKLMRELAAWEAADHGAR